MSLRGHHKAAGASVQMTTLLVVRIGHNLYALPSKEVRGVLTKEEVGNSKVVNALGLTYRDMDLASRLSQTVDQQNSEGRTVLYSNGQTHGAIRVDEVVDMIDVKKDDCKSLPPQFQGDERAWIAGTTIFRNQLALILNPEWVLGEIGEIDSVSSADAGHRQTAYSEVPGAAC